jgi:hypothetical protein
MANWLDFQKMQDWDYLFFPGFQYDDIPDAHIEDALADEANLRLVNPAIDWECDSWLAQNTTIPSRRKHAYRVAALIRAFRAGDLMIKGISLDTFNVQRCRSCVSDGHHRVRALQYLGLNAGPFWMGGHVDALEALVDIAGTTPPPEAIRYCAPRLLLPESDDIRPHMERVETEPESAF